MAEELKLKDLQEEKVGPKILSKINMLDNGFEIKVGEIKNLPYNYTDKILTMACLKKGDLELLSTPKDSKLDSLDDKDTANFLNQNGKTVIKQLRINDLSQIDLKKLQIAEFKGKQRKNILDFIKVLQKVI